MTTKERMLAAIRCEPVDYVPLSMHFWHHPRHARAHWRSERERLAMFGEWEWDTTAEVATNVTPSPEVRVEVAYEHDGTVLHQVWHTPAGDLEERLKVTEDWEAAQHVAGYLPVYDDFRASRYLETMIHGADDLPKLQYLFPVENAADTDALVRQHRRARALADEFQVPVSVNHPAGMDWLIWLYSARGAVLEALDHRPVIEGVLRIINEAYAQRLEVALDLGVDMVERRGWYESADFWNPALFESLAAPLLVPEIEATHRAGAVHVYLMDTGVVPLLPQLASLEFDCLHGLEPAYTNLDQKELRRRLPGKSIWGGISGPQDLGRGTPESIACVVEKAFADYGRTGFLLGMAVGIRENWPEENLAACEEAWRRLRAGTGRSSNGRGREGRSVRVIDISAPMRCGEEIECEVPAALPVYCGYPCEEYRFSFRSHLGCYFETSAHLFRGGTMTSDVPVARLLLPAMVARLEAERGGVIESEEIAAALDEPIRPGDALLVDTRGRDDRFFSRACAAWMVAQHVALVGATLERYDTGFENPTGAFVEWFRAEVPIIAGLRNLDRVRAERVFLIVLPIAVERVCTAPCRAVVLEGDAGEVAWLEEHLGAREVGEDSSGAARIPFSSGRMGKECQR